MAEQMTNSDAPLTVRIVTPNGVAAEAACDSVILPVADGKSGTGGGSMGIRRGHAQAMIALAEGTVRARLAGNTVLSAAVTSGIASVGGNVVRILAEHVEKTIAGEAPGAGKSERD